MLAITIDSLGQCLGVKWLELGARFELWCHGLLRSLGKCIVSSGLEWLEPHSLLRVGGCGGPVFGMGRSASGSALWMLAGRSRPTRRRWRPPTTIWRSSLRRRLAMASASARPRRPPCRAFRTLERRALAGDNGIQRAAKSDCRRPRAVRTANLPASPGNHRYSRCRQPCTPLQRPSRDRHSIRYGPLSCTDFEYSTPFAPELKLCTVWRFVGCLPWVVPS